MSEDIFIELTKKSLDRSLDKGNYSYKTELFILSLKSLLALENKLELSINYDRYDREFALWKYYRTGSNPALDNILFQFNEESYLGEGDDSIIYRLLPLIFTNTVYENMYEELVKNILYTTGNLDSIVENILISKLIFMLLNSYKDIDHELKEEVMNLRQEDFIDNFGNSFRIDIDGSSDKFKIAFEKTKIRAISILNGIEDIRMKKFSRLYNIYLSNEDNERGDLLGLLIEGLEEEDFYESEISYFGELGAYLYKMRKSRIDPRLLLIEDYVMPNIFEYEKGECFNHSLLSTCRVVDKEIKNNLLYVRLETKSGVYNFRKPIRR